MEFRTRKIIMPAHLNGAGNLFGGQALAWIDEEAAVYAACQLGDSNVVTKFISDINFQSPGKLNDIVEIGCDVVGTGRTSITIRCVLRNKTTKRDMLTVDRMVFVLLDSEGRPKEHGLVARVADVDDYREGSYERDFSMIYGVRH